MNSLTLPFSNSTSKIGGLGLALACLLVAIQVGAVSAQERASDVPGFTAPLTRVLGPVSEQATSPSQTTVGILNADGGTASGAILALNGTGLLESANISVINESGSTPTLQELLEFDVVIIWTNSSFSDPSGTGDVLADYVDGGGSVVIATYALTISSSQSSSSWWIGGRFEDPGYMPLLPSTNKLNHSYVMDMSSVPPGHPIFDGITNLTYSGNSNYSNSPLNTDAILLATDTNGNNLVAVNPLGTVAAISIWPGENLQDNNDPVSRLFANALIFVANGGFGITTPRFVNENPIDIEGVASDSLVTSVEVSVNHGPFQSVAIDSVRKFLLANTSLVPDSNWVIAHGFNANDSLIAADSAVVILDQILPQIVRGPEAFGVLHNEATIVLDTDEPTDARAFWGLTPELGEFLLLKPTSTQVDTSLATASKKRGTDHRITLEFLPADTVVYYVVVIVDRAGNSAGFSSVKSFTTKRGPDTIDPRFVEFPVIIAITDSMATVTFVTDELTTGMVYLYNEFGSYITDIDGPSDANFEHRIKISDLSPGTKYKIKVYIEDISDNETSSGFVLFRTRDIPDTRAPTVRSIQVDPKSRATFTVITSEPAKIKIFLIVVGTAPVSKRLEDDDYIIISSDEFRRVSQLTEGGFLEGATYQFHVEAEDQSGNVGVSRPRTFTVRAPDTTPPIILYSVILQNGGEYAVLGIGTDERTTARVDYAPVDDPTDISTVFSNLARNSHIVIITNLALDTGYQFTFTVTDQSNNSTSSSPSVSARQIAEMSEAKTLFKVLQGPGQTGRFTTNQSPDTQAPVILNGPTIVAQSSDALTVQWETDELSSSIVEYGDGNFNETESLSDNVTTHTVTLSGLTSSTTYQYRISSQDPTGNGPTLGPAPLNVAAATTTIESDISPPQISNVTEASVTNDRAIITFTTDEPGDSFVDFDTDMSTFGQSLGSTNLKTSHSVTITNLAPGTTYYYRARSTDANGNGPGFGGTESFTTALVADTADPVVSNLSVRSGFRFAVITWDTDEVSNSFIQLVDGTSDTLSVATLNLTTSHSVTVADTTFLPGSANLYTVIAGSTDPSGNSGESNAQFTTLAEADTTAPEIPSGLAATAGNGVVSLAWSDISDPDFGGFLIFRILSGDTTQVATGVTDNSYLDESVSNDSSYTYFLQSVDLAIPTPNISESSASIGVTPASGAEPTAPSAVSPTTSVNVSLKPILLINDAVLGTSGGTLAYTFAVYSDSALTQLVASIAGIQKWTPETGQPVRWRLLW